MEEGNPAGAMGLKHITSHDAEYWGYIGEKKYWGKGIGAFMIDEAIKKAIVIGLQQLYLHVDRNNERAKQLYIKKGFQISGVAETEKYLLQL